MAKFNQDVPQFGSAKPANTGGSPHCAQCELMLADALDGTLSAAEQAEFDQHLAGCSTCSQMLADAKRGAAWLELLRVPRPEPSPALLERILAQTSTPLASLPGSALSVVTPGAMTLVATSSVHSAALEERAPEALPGTGAKILPFRSRIAAAFQGKGFGPSMLQPRLAMTAAMAFFSVGLTLNLTGVHLNQLRAADLKPASLRRSFYQANAHVVRYYDNLRVVYELESRVRDLQRASDNGAPVTPEAPDQTKTPEKPAKPNKKGAPVDGQPSEEPARPRPNSGTSRRQGLSGPTSLLASYRADTQASPTWCSACASPTDFMLVSTLQEGELL